MASSVVGRALQTTAGFLAALLFGVFCANWPKRPNQLIKPVNLRFLGKLCMLVCAPLLLAVTMAEGFSHEQARDMGVILLWSFLSIVLSLAISSLVVVVARVPPSFRDEFLIGCAFSNAFAAPVVMMQTLCQQEPLSTTSFGEKGNISCEDRALTWITVYTTGWIIIFFSTAFPWLMHTKPSVAAEELVDDSKPAKGRPSCWHRAMPTLKNIMNPNLVAALVGVAAGAIPQLQTALFDGELVWVSSAMKTLGQPAVGLSAIVVGTTLGQTLPKVWSARPACCRYGGSSNDSKASDMQPGGSQICEHGEGGDTDASSDSPEIKVGSGVLGAPMRQIIAPKRQLTLGVLGVLGGRVTEVAAEQPLPSVRVLVAFVATRMILCPMAGIAMVYLLADSVLVSSDARDRQLIKLVLVLEASVPSADFVIVTCTVAGRTTGAQALALAYLFQYLVGIFSLTFATGFALEWIYEG